MLCHGAGDAMGLTMLWGRRCYGAVGQVMLWGCGAGNAMGQGVLCYGAGDAMGLWGRQCYGAGSAVLWGRRCYGAVGRDVGQLLTFPPPPPHSCPIALEGVLARAPHRPWGTEVAVRRAPPWDPTALLLLGAPPEALRPLLPHNSVCSCHPMGGGSVLLMALPVGDKGGSGGGVMGGAMGWGLRAPQCPLAAPQPPLAAP